MMLPSPPFGRKTPVTHPACSRSAITRLKHKDVTIKSLLHYLKKLLHYLDDMKLIQQWFDFVEESSSYGTTNLKGILRDDDQDENGIRTSLKDVLSLYTEVTTVPVC